MSGIRAEGHIRLKNAGCIHRDCGQQGSATALVVVQLDRCPRFRLP